MNGSQTPRKHFTYYYQFIIEDVIKVTNEQPEEEAHRVRHRMVSCSGASVPLEFVGRGHLRARGCIHQP